MDKKPYGLGVTVGRFQTFHTGHRYMLDKALEMCDTVGVFIGSSQESGTYKNPFPYELRADLLRAIYGDKIKIFPLPDIGVGNNSTWGDYVLKNVIDRFGKAPDLLISGKETRRNSWFDSAAGTEISELYVPKIIEISASQMRCFFVDGDRESWKKYTPPEIWDRYEALREIVLNSKDNTETASM